MRPSLTLILIILALLVSIVVGLFLGGGPQVWFSERIEESGNGNANLPLAPSRPTALSDEPALLPTPSSPASSPRTNAASTPRTTPSTLPPTETASPIETSNVDATPIPPPPTEGVRVTIISNALRLRSAPSTDGAVIATLLNGVEGIAVQRDSNGWLEVEVAELEVRGWLFAGADFVTVEGNIESLPLLES